MMQPYCRAKVRRGEVVEECGRVLSTAGTCDRKPPHAPGQESAFPTAGR
jgi:hypothetical protein